MALRSGSGLTVPLKVSECTDNREAGDGKGLIPVSIGVAIPSGQTAVTSPPPRPHTHTHACTHALHSVISSWDILYKNLEDKLVTFKKIFVVSTYLPSHTSFIDGLTFRTTK